MYATQMIFQVISIGKQDSTVGTLVIFVAMVTVWMIFELEYSGVLIVTVITWMLLI